MWLRARACGGGGEQAGARGTRPSYISIVMPTLYACVRVCAQNICMCMYKLASTTNKTRRSFLDQGDTVTVTMARRRTRALEVVRGVMIAV